MIELLFVCNFRIVFQFRSVSNSVIPTSESSYLTSEVGKYVPEAQETLQRYCSTVIPRLTSDPANEFFG